MACSLKRVLLLLPLLLGAYCLGEEKPATTGATQVAEAKIPKVTEEFDAKVLEVTEGDTIRVRTADNREIQVRLEGIDAPEKEQPDFKRSTSYLNASVAGMEVSIHKTGQDRDGRILGLRHARPRHQHQPEDG